MSDAVEIVDDFISAADCARLLAGAAAGGWQGSASALPDGQNVAGAERGRRSASIWEEALASDAVFLLSEIEARVAARHDVALDHFETWQMSRYRRGDFFDYHLDCGAFAGHPSGERRRTFLIVLEAPTRGGATHFRALGLTVRPHPGRLIVWRNLLPSGGCNHAMIHSGRPVWQGCKTIVTTWEHELPFLGRPNLGAGRTYNGHEA